MTSTFATNYVSSRLQKKRYLETNTQGQPLQGQVPLTYQVYSGTGNETITYDGSSVFILDSTLASGDLTLDFSDTQNWYGRALSFIAYRHTSNDVIFDFGTSTVYYPPFTGSASTITLLASSTPYVTALCFINPTTVIVTQNPTINPNNIAPGGPGQVLTTDSGTGVVQWEDPAPPRALTFKISTDTINDLNKGSPAPVYFDSTTGSNDTTLTLADVSGQVYKYTVTRASKYSISFNIFSVQDPSIALRAWIGINSDTYCFSESTLGLTGQTLSGSLTIDLKVGDVIRMNARNATGTVTPIVPAFDYYGTLSITEF